MSCWTCTDVILINIGKNKWKCTKCHDIYFDCQKCSWINPNEISIDCEENDKGIWCDGCGSHFCASCWQNTGELTDVDIAGPEKYCCEKCVIARKKQ
jgi:hypothetical protein